MVVLEVNEHQVPVVVEQEQVEKMASVVVERTGLDILVYRSPVDKVLSKVCHLSRARRAMVMAAMVTCCQGRQHRPGLECGRRSHSAPLSGRKSRTGRRSSPATGRVRPV